MRIVIETIPHKDQRYPTVGDWWEDPDGTWHIRVSSMDHWKSEFLVALHELVEMALCKVEGIDGDQVTEFDERFLAHNRGVEPGDSLAAPYYMQHQAACGFERLMAAQMRVVWPAYEARVAAL